MDANTPIPKDVTLPLPVPPELLVVFHVVFFAMHILFVNLLLGGALLTFFYELRGRWRPDYDALAHEIAKTISVNKSMAVVMGVGPLLFINLLYTSPFYGTTTLIGDAWIKIIPLVTVAFLLLYLHKYSWERMHAHKGLHIVIIGAVCAILLCVPLIFLTTINLMLFPELWAQVRGFADALFLPNVLPRYLHFLLASLSVMGLFMVKWTQTRHFPAETLFQELTRGELRRQFYTLAFAATALQFLAGPLVFFTLPPAGMNVRTMLAVLCGVACALPALWWMWQELDGGGTGAGRRYWHIIGAISLTVMFMVIGRHLYRAEALNGYQQAVAVKTAAYEQAVAQAQKGVFPKAVGPDAEPPKANDPGKAQAPAFQSPWRSDPRFAQGETIYKTVCIVCHAPAIKVIGPPIMEIAGLDPYKGHPEAIAKWAIQPGPPKRQPPIPMPPVARTLDELTAAGVYMLAVGEEEAHKAAAGKK
jgi:cytochrome c